MTLTMQPALLLAEGGFNPLNMGDIGIAFWTWIIFLLALPPAWLIVMGPITRALEQRDERAIEAIERADEASRAAERARAEVEVRLGEAQTAAVRLLAEARERGEQREREIIELAKREADALRERARADIDTARDQALSAIRDEVVELSLSAATQVLRRTVDSEDDRRLVRELVSGARRPGAGGRA